MAFKDLDAQEINPWNDRAGYAGAELLQKSARKKMGMRKMWQ